MSQHTVPRRHFPQSLFRGVLRQVTNIRLRRLRIVCPAAPPFPPLLKVALLTLKQHCRHRPRARSRHRPCGSRRGEQLLQSGSDTNSLRHRPRTSPPPPPRRPPPPRCSLTSVPVRRSAAVPPPTTTTIRSSCTLPSLAPRSAQMPTTTRSAPGTAVRKRKTSVPTAAVCNAVGAT